MKHPKDLTGLFFGGLEVLGYAGKTISSKTKWLCLCGCGNKKIIARNCLIAGSTKSCGCLARKNSSERLKKYRESQIHIGRERFSGANIDDAIDSLEAIS